MRTVRAIAVVQVRRWCWVTSDQVDEAWLRQRFDAMDAADYGGAQDAADFAYTWESLLDVRAFYDRAAKAGRAVIFTAS